MTDKLEAFLRERLTGFNSLWIDEAIEKARLACDDESTVSAAIAAIQARVDAFSAEVSTLERQNDANEAELKAANAAIAACEGMPDRGIIH